MTVTLSVAEREGGLVARSGALAERPDRFHATLTIETADARLGQKIARAVGAALRAVAPAAPLDRVVRLCTAKAIAGHGDLTGALVLVAVTARDARRLPDLVDALRAAGPRAIQLVWDGEVPPRRAVERYVFATLERARTARFSGPPVVLAKTERPAIALRFAQPEGKSPPC